MDLDLLIHPPVDSLEDKQQRHQDVLGDPGPERVQD
jgi:hypothetical protein